MCCRERSDVCVSENFYVSAKYDFGMFSDNDILSATYRKSNEMPCDIFNIMLYDDFEIGTSFGIRIILPKYSELLRKNNVSYNNVSKTYFSSFDKKEKSETATWVIDTWTYEDLSDTLIFVFRGIVTCTNRFTISNMINDPEPTIAIGPRRGTDKSLLLLCVNAE